MNGLNEVEILLVEDNPDDLDMAVHALRKMKLANKIQVARDGVEALAVSARQQLADAGLDGGADDAGPLGAASAALREWVAALREAVSTLVGAWRAAKAAREAAGLVVGASQRAAKGAAGEAVDRGKDAVAAAANVVSNAVSVAHPWLDGFIAFVDAGLTLGATAPLVAPAFAIAKGILEKVRWREVTQLCQNLSVPLFVHDASRAAVGSG